MSDVTVTFLPEGISVPVPRGCTLLQAQIEAGLHPDAPCGGNGTCGKCLVILDGREVPACRTRADRDMTVTLPEAKHLRILTEGTQVPVTPDGTDRYALAFNIGTTTVAAALFDGGSGAVLARESCPNPQRRYGADVISRLQYVRKTGDPALTEAIRETLAVLTEAVCRKAGIPPEEITRTAIAGNTAMHHLLLGIDPKPLLTPPYMPAVTEALEMAEGRVRILPNIAGFVGGDTVGCMVAARFDQIEELTLLIDIGTNGEMVLGNRHRRIACSTAAGPAFEGAKISCGMAGATGAVDHVTLDAGQLSYHVIGEGRPLGLCGSGLLDLVAALLETGEIAPSGRMGCKEFTLCEHVTLTRKDVRELQLAKAAIQAGIALMAQQLGVEIRDIRRVLLAGAFGSFLNPRSACRIGMIPPELSGKIRAIGNAAGEGARLCALSRDEFARSRRLAEQTEFLELASLPQFQQRYLQALNFPE